MQPMIAKQATANEMDFSPPLVQCNVNIGQQIIIPIPLLASVMYLAHSLISVLLGGLLKLTNMPITRSI